MYLVRPWTSTSQEEGGEEGRREAKKEDKKKRAQAKKKAKPRRRHKPRSKRAGSERIDKTFPSLKQTGESSSIHLDLGCLIVILQLGSRILADLCMWKGGAQVSGAYVQGPLP